MYLQQKAAKGGHNKQATAHSVTIVNQLKLQLMHTTKDFKEVLEQRSKTMIAQQKRRGKFGQDNGAVLAKPMNFAPRPTASQLGPNAESGAVISPIAPQVSRTDPFTCCPVTHPLSVPADAAIDTRPVLSATAGECSVGH